ncbi:DUF2125 domain-containing protein [Acuticoccus sp.]|uniref:DUF2125 domain-containing protein n=1 Tax=Acuticoccus sp. TaxID=1904378 RepID=UPI003B526478
MGLALAVVVGWSVVWFVAATVVDRQLDKAILNAEARGATLSCVNRTVAGYPFRIEVRCGAGSHAGSGGNRIALSGLRVAAQVYNPSHIIAEADGPMQVALGEGQRGVADWTLAHASARIDLSGQALRQLVAELTDVTLAMETGREVTVGEIDASVRRDPEAVDDLGVALRLEDVVPAPGMPPATLSLRGRVGGGAALLEAEPAVFAAQLMTSGLPLEVEAATLRSGDVLLALSGTLTLGTDGLVDGVLDVSVAGYEGEVPYVAVLDPEAGSMVSSLMTNFFANAPKTKIGEREARTMSVIIDNSQVKPGGWFTVWTLPPLLIASH